MDEVEAALDDANLGRLLTVMEELREHSQLIVVTHRASDAALSATVNALAGLDSVDDVASVMRVEGD